MVFRAVHSAMPTWHMLSRVMGRATIIIRRPAEISPRLNLRADSERRKELCVANAVPFKSHNGWLGGRAAAAH